ncbi:hypothetical protein B0T24DRAFT_383244 [Lasiosphaeria ovina]|uniref:Uncharacterized protein n=1 Tax=Lasiosphaeria ovina TaxID=92902 RepID=A0AAE0JZA1_9PEZI|nr:hypothetical protein B0T24DRAFT_383244 [Lasiosphaeria ovina]
MECCRLLNRPPDHQNHRHRGCTWTDRQSARLNGKLGIVIAACMALLMANPAGANDLHLAHLHCTAIYSLAVRGDADRDHGEGIYLGQCASPIPILPRTWLHDPGSLAGSDRALASHGQTHFQLAGTPPRLPLRPAYQTPPGVPWAMHGDAAQATIGHIDPPFPPAATPWASCLGEPRTAKLWSTTKLK